MTDVKFSIRTSQMSSGLILGLLVLHLNTLPFESRATDTRSLLDMCLMLYSSSADTGRGLPLSITDMMDDVLTPDCIHQYTVPSDDNIKAPVSESETSVIFRLDTHFISDGLTHVQCAYVPY